MPASESLPRSRRKRRSLNTSQSDRTRNGSHPDPPAARAPLPRSHRRTNGTQPPGRHPTQLPPNNGTGRYKRRTRNGGPKRGTAEEKGGGRRGEHVLDSSRSPSPAAVQPDPRPEGGPPAARPRSWRSRGFSGSEKRTKWAKPVNPCYLLKPPMENEDWEKEIAPDQPYGPEDLISVALRDLSLHPKDPPTPPAETNYNPARSHPLPVDRTSCSPTAEEGQFSDVDQ